jgi:two-component system, NtrC family, C4-dicarboxylate transport sensor histidine kinase DctB
VAATDRNRLGTNHRNQPYFVDAQRAKDTVFTAWRRETPGGYRFHLFARGSPTTGCAG